MSLTPFRSSFIRIFQEQMASQSCLLTTQEIGALQSRYRQVYQATPRGARMRIFEQMLIAILLWLLYSDDIASNDDLVYITIIMEASQNIRTLFNQVNVAVDVD